MNDLTHLSSCHSFFIFPAGIDVDIPALAVLDVDVAAALDVGGIVFGDVAALLFGCILLIFLHTGFNGLNQFLVAAFLVHPGRKRIDVLEDVGDFAKVVENLFVGLVGVADLLHEDGRL